MTMTTYKITSDLDGRLKKAARTACIFWNRFVEPSTDVVLRLGTFSANSRVIARAWTPKDRRGVRYGSIEYNTKYLKKFTANESASTVIHEIGHTFGIGWSTWETLFSPKTGRFLPHAVERIPAPAEMWVELEHGEGTALAHWDEERYGKELMTGLKNDGEEYVLPITLEVMALFGHKVVERLSGKTSLGSLIREQPIFSRHDEARAIDRDYWEPTSIREELVDLYR